MSERERYSVMLNGHVLVGAGMSRHEALGAALEVVDGETSAQLLQVDIVEQDTRERCARWLRCGPGWRATSAPEWLP